MKMLNRQFRLILAVTALILVSSCSKDYVYYKSKCACAQITNYADFKKA